MRTVVAKWQAMGFRVASVNVLSLALVISVLWFPWESGSGSRV